MLSASLLRVRIAIARPCCFPGKMNPRFYLQKKAWLRVLRSPGIPLERNRERNGAPLSLTQSKNLSHATFSLYRPLKSGNDLNLTQRQPRSQSLPPPHALILRVTSEPSSDKRRSGGRTGSRGSNFLLMLDYGLHIFCHRLALVGSAE